MKKTNNVEQSKIKNELQPLNNLQNENIMNNKKDTRNLKAVTFDLVNSEKKLSTTMPVFMKTNGSFFGTKKVFKSLNATTYKVRMGSLSKSPKKPILPTHKRGNGIPNNLFDRFTFLKSLFRDKKFLAYYKATPPRQKTPLDTVVKYICKYTGKKGEIETYAMIYYYICNQITYDLKGMENGKNNRIDQSPEVVFRNGVALSDGFVRLFEYFCNKIYLKCRTIEGVCKVLPRNPKNKYENNHVWNTIYYRGEWYFVDLTLGSGGNQEKISPVANSNSNNSITAETQTKDHNEDYFNPYYFLTFPEYLIITQRPAKDEWQMTEKTMTQKQFFNKKFIDIGLFYQKVYQHDIELLTHTFPYIHLTNFNLSIQIKALNMFVQCDLFHLNGRDKIAEIKYISNEDTNIITVDPVFPNHGEYIVRISGRNVASTDLIYGKLLDYRVNITDERKFRFNLYRIGKKKSLSVIEPPISMSMSMPKSKFNFPQGKIYTSYPIKNEKKIPILDDEGVYLYEPRSLFLKKGNEYKFKIKVKGALVVAVLDGKKWTYLKRKEENIYEGTSTIQTDYVSICSLKSCNVYTEVYRFKPPKDKSVNVHTQD